MSTDSSTQIERRRSRWIRRLTVPGVLGLFLASRAVRPLFRVLDDAVLIPLGRRVAQAIDFFGPLWGAALSAGVLFATIWVVRRLRGVFDERRSANPPSLPQFTPLALTPSPFRAHTQLATKGFIFGMVLMGALYVIGAEDDLPALGVAALIVGLIAFLVLEVIHAVRGGSQDIALDRSAAHITTRRGHEAVPWSEVERVKDEMAKDGFHLVAGSASFWVNPTGHRPAEMDRLVELARERVSSHREQVEHNDAENASS